jgi:carboxymethylenebutenolidase
MNMIPKITRRGFVKTSLTSGFALATVPVSAATIATDATGLTAGEAKIPTKDGQIPAYYAMPAKGNSHPTILVIQEVFGVHEHIKDVCRRFAKMGHLAIAPELYARQGDASTYDASRIPQLMADIVSKVPDEQVMSDLDAAVAWAAKNKGNNSKLSITGFCWGGRIVWLYSAHNPKVKAGVAWYGRLVGTPSALTPKHPVDIAPTLKVPVLGLYGGQDTGIPVDTIEQMKKALGPKTRSEFHVYPDAPHAFHADYRPSYREDAAKDGWKRANAWLKGHGAV